MAVKIMASARKHPKGKVAPGPAKKRVAVKKPKVTGGPQSGPKQKPTKTPMTAADRLARAKKGHAMHKAGVKGPVKYKMGGGAVKKR